MQSARAAGWSIGVAALAFGAWTAFVGDSSPQELIFGGVCAVFTAAVSLLTWSAMGLSVRARASDVLQIWRVPWRLVSDAGSIVLALFRDLFGVERAGSYFRAVRFERAHGPRATMRRVLAIGYTTITPNFIAVGIDRKRGWMLFHQLRRGAVPEEAKRLGAQA